MRTALYFGSFNPVHNGHIAIARFVKDSGLCDQVWFVISPQNPLKATEELADESHRLAMLELAVGEYKDLKISTIEFSMPRPSYTIDTLDRLKQDFSEYEFSIIMGMDNLALLSQWKNSERIVDENRILVYPRLGFSMPETVHPNIHVMHEAPLFDVSSTQIRQKLWEGKSVSGLIPENIIQYIKDNALYKKSMD